jgi:hypothetical protein
MPVWMKVFGKSEVSCASKHHAMEMYRDEEWRYSFIHWHSHHQVSPLSPIADLEIMVKINRTRMKV